MGTGPEAAESDKPVQGLLKATGHLSPKAFRAVALGLTDKTLAMTTFYP